MPATPKAKQLLREWRTIVARTHPGERSPIDRDIPIYLASVRTTKAEAVLAAAMVAWLPRPRSAEPWEAIERALSLKSEDANAMGARAVSAVCLLRPSRFEHALAVFDRAHVQARRCMLRIGLGPRHRRALLMHAAADPEDVVCIDALGDAALDSDRRLFPPLLPIVRERGQTARLRAELKRYSALYRQGYFAQRKQDLYVFEVSVPQTKLSIGGLSSEDVPLAAVRRLGEPLVAETIRRTLEDTSLPWPIEWDSIEAPPESGHRRKEA